MVLPLRKVFSPVQGHAAQSSQDKFNKLATSLREALPTAVMHAAVPRQDEPTDLDPPNVTGLHLSSILAGGAISEITTGEYFCVKSDCLLFVVSL